MKIKPMPRWRTNPSKMASTCNCTVTSSAEVGSSAISSSGLAISIMAIMARWPMPPETSCGYSLNTLVGSSICTDSSATNAAWRASRPDTRLCARSVSMIWSPIVITGFSENLGSCSTMAMRPPRSARRWRGEQPSKSVP